MREKHYGAILPLAKYTWLKAKGLAVLLPHEAK